MNDVITTHSKYVLLFLLASCTAFDDPKPVLNPKTQIITFKVKAHSDACMPRNVVVIAQIDNYEKTKTTAVFDCKDVTKTVAVIPGDVVEVKVFDATYWLEPPSLDKSIRYDIMFIQETREYEFKDLDYTGTKYKVK